MVRDIKTSRALERSRFGGRWQSASLVCLAFGLAVGVGLSTATAEMPEQTPYMCLNVAGHTAPVWTMAFSADSSRLYTAGLDKTVHVWRHQGEGANESWADQRRLRWDVARSRRGSIFALAVAPGTGGVTIGGFSARATNGDIVTLDPNSGEVLKVRTGQHRENIQALAYSTSGRWMASSDFTGRVLLWPADGDQPRELYPGDRETVLGRPIAVVGDQGVLVPVPAGRNGQGTLEWRIQQYSIATGQVERTFNQIHFGAVRALAASADGRRFASADEAQQLFVTDLQSGVPQRLPTAESLFSLAFSPRGDMLAGGTSTVHSRPGTELRIWEIWDLANGTVRRKVPLTEPVYACAFSPDGRWLAYFGAWGHDITVERLDQSAGRSPFAAASRWCEWGWRRRRRAIRRVLV